MELSSQLHYPAALQLGKKPSTHLVRGWVGLTVSWNVYKKSLNKTIVYYLYTHSQINCASHMTADPLITQALSFQQKYC